MSMMLFDYCFVLARNLVETSRREFGGAIIVPPTYNVFESKKQNGRNDDSPFVWVCPLPLSVVNK